MTTTGISTATKLAFSEFIRKYACAPGVISKQIRAGKLKAFQRGGKTIITATEAERWLASLSDREKKKWRLKGSGPYFGTSGT
jgi:hypothetical protein